MRSTSELKREVEKIIQDLNEAEQALLRRVIKAEQEKLHMGNPRYIYSDIDKAIKDTIK